MPLDADAVTRWFDDYFETFAACVRGEQELAALLRHYGVPLILTTDDGVTVLMTDDEAVAVMQSLVDGLRANGYHHSTVLQSEVSVINATSALFRATLSLRDGGGVEISCPTITYLVIDDVADLRIAVLASHGQIT